MKASRTLCGRFADALRVGGFQNFTLVTSSARAHSLQGRVHAHAHQTSLHKFKQSLPFVKNMSPTCRQNCTWKLREGKSLSENKDIRKPKLFSRF